MRMMYLALGVGVVRFLMIGLGSHDVWLLVVAQLMHAATFALHHSSSVMSLQRWFSGPLQARGQALYMSISYGIGGSVGGLFLAQWWERAGAESVYFVAAVLVCLSAVAATLSFRWQRNDGYQSGLTL
jgi:PPP family 3-phenylpropionic acid transporter